MSDERTLLALQKRQKDHDIEHHPDIYNTSYPDRMNHYTLHFSKYVGRFSRDYDTKADLENRLEKTLADGLIVGLAAANTLNIDLQNQLTEQGAEINGIPDVSDHYNLPANDFDLVELQEWLMTQMATPTGRMADAMESLDHMESMNGREILENGTVEIFKALLFGAQQSGYEPASLIEDRWNEIEDESIL
jgi:hypothetical protein